MGLVRDMTGLALSHLGAQDVTQVHKCATVWVQYLIGNFSKVTHFHVYASRHLNPNWEKKYLEDCTSVGHLNINTQG